MSDRYFARQGSQLSDTQAALAADFILEYCDENRAIKPEVLAENRDDPRLAGWFHETDQEAAYNWRVEKARQLLRYIYVASEDDEGNPFEERAFYPVTQTIEVASDTGTPEIKRHRAYRPTVEIIRVPVERDEVYEDVLKRFREMRERYKSWKQLKEVFDAIDRL